ncbi:murein hydrolase activator EnvC family protein [Pedococcus sp. NPDC057267]|uniref:murein hydrolase activator EnvC family protein n=1 Tax=Pedococcus sp. NPDC057267 TaxID=3346077 RepID=UPI00362A79AD
MSTASSVVPAVASVLVAGAALTGVGSTASPSPTPPGSASTVAPGPGVHAVGSGPLVHAARPEPERYRSAGGRGGGAAGLGRAGAETRQDGLVAAAPRGRWQWPLTPRPQVARPYAAPRSTWGAGHRGVDLASASGQPVRAVAAGTVTHVGVIAGRPTVTVTHPDGLRSTYEPVDASVRSGDSVTAGQALGTLVVAGSHCSPSACLHLGALRGREYLDPMTLLGPVRVRLLPLWRAGP